MLSRACKATPRRVVSGFQFSALPTRLRVSEVGKRPTLTKGRVPLPAPKPLVCVFGCLLQQHPQIPRYVELDSRAKL